MTEPSTLPGAALVIADVRTPVPAAHDVELTHSGFGLPPERNPVTVYLGRLISAHSRRTMRTCLATLARLL